MKQRIQIFYQMDFESYTQVGGKSAGQQVFQAVRALGIFKIGRRADEGDHPQDTLLLDLFEHRLRPAGIKVQGERA